MTTSPASENDQWWYCLKHGAVEKGRTCRAEDRMGPYADEGAARRALDTAASRTQNWDSDPDWNDDR